MSKSKQGREAVIVNEIKFWKQNNMLPDQYCDYLLALYTNGNDPIQDTTADKRNSNHSITAILLSAFIISFSLFVIYFTELSVVLQTAILTGFVVSLFGMRIYYTKKKISTPFIHIAAAFLILILSLNISESLFDGSRSVTYAVLILNCILWMILGWKRKLLYFTLSGALGILIILFSILR
ncbi:hypothetical protein [Rossellomorea aquimaris]|jgi:hypothetical protein|uniref:DUF2157 domain-containing protein n=1 Tax=Rossellomorea aquimaris TaxID=189382 RepID=A0A1J6WQU7_9BACI|nr:hypothetical protein [Rossellomorea aquimaris]OIU70587.1 hypothetical protein BHE18_18875 [Rossellomorea aquimaris]